MTRSAPTLLLVCALGIPMAAAASCGASYCALNTQWDTQGMDGEPGRLMLDLRYEHIRQEQLRRGSHNIPLSQATGESAELKTVNRNLVAGLDYALDSHWSLSASLPVARRSHTHIEDPTGTPAYESWNFTRVGDVRVLGRYRIEKTDPSDHLGLQFGLKLPTGQYRLVNGEGTLAERSLQPGSGSTDLVLGGYYAYRPPYRDLGWFGQALYQRAVLTRDNFRPGSQLSLTGGLNYPASDSVTLLLQINAQIKGRDGGANAEPALSGSRNLYASPGASFAVTPDTQIYGFLQLPLLRHVNGIQLVARRALVAGLNMRF